MKLQSDINNLKTQLGQATQGADHLKAKLQARQDLNKKELAELEKRARGDRDGYLERIKEKGEQLTLMERGFEYADSSERIYVPIAIDREALALAFEKGDFAEAMVPVRQAVELVVAAKGDLDGLIGLLRQRDKG